jgi:small subunit ribosomal protein S6
LETVVKRLYEAMFLVDSAQAAADWEGTLSVINNILQRADAEVVAIRKWQERKLAYDIDRKTRGTYILCYFKADGRRISGIEKDVQLSEKVMRVLVLTTEKRPPEMIERDITGVTEEKSPEAPGEAPKAEKPTAAAAAPAAGASDVAAADTPADDDSEQDEGDDDSEQDEGDEAKAEAKEETAR